MVRNYKRKTQDRWTKEELLKALICINEVKLTVNDAARQFGISRATLYRQYQKFQLGGSRYDVNQFKTCGGNPILTRLEENVLEKTVKDLRDQGYSVTASDIKRICYEYCEANGVPNQFHRNKRAASDDWYYGFLKRHPAIRLNPNSNSKIRSGDDSKSVGSNGSDGKGATSTPPPAKKPLKRSAGDEGGRVVKRSKRNKAPTSASDDSIPAVANQIVKKELVMVKEEVIEENEVVEDEMDVNMEVPAGAEDDEEVETDIETDFAGEEEDQGEETEEESESDEVEDGKKEEENNNNNEDKTVGRGGTNGDGDVAAASSPKNKVGLSNSVPDNNVLAVVNSIVQPENKFGEKDGAVENPKVVEDAKDEEEDEDESDSDSEGGDEGDDSEEEESDSDDNGEDEEEEKSGDVNKPEGFNANVAPALSPKPLGPGMAVMNQVVQPESKILKDGAGEKARVVEVEGSGVGGESASEDEGGDSEEESDSDEDGEEEVEEKSGDVNKPVGLSGNGGLAPASSPKPEEPGMAVMNQVQPENKILKDGAREKKPKLVEGSGAGGQSASEDEDGDSEEESESEEDGKGGEEKPGAGDEAPSDDEEAEEEEDDEDEDDQDESSDEGEEEGEEEEETDSDEEEDEEEE